MTTPAPIRIIIADDHVLFRRGFRLVMERQEDIEIIADASNGKELLELTLMLRPHVIITDIRMPEMDGIEACRIIKRKWPEVGVLAISLHEDPGTVQEMISAGATGFLLKDATRQEVLKAVRAVASGQMFYNRHITPQLMGTRAVSSNETPPSNIRTLFTDRELQVIDLICKQYTGKEIADALNLSQRTIEDVRNRIQEKTGAKNTIGIALYAIREKLVSIDD